MKPGLFLLQLALCFLFSNQLPAQKTLKQVEILTFDLAKNKGDLLILEDSSILLANSVKNSMTQFAVEDIHYVNIQTKKNNSGHGTLLGILLGVIPGTLVLASVSRLDGLDAILLGPATVVLGSTLFIGGAIAGDIIGARAGRSVYVQIPINGNQRLYEKQKLQLQNHFE